MPKVIEYPSSSFAKALELANAVDYLGGNCTVQSCADKLNKKVSGGFGMLISSAIKHSLITRKREEMFTTKLFKDIKLAYNDGEKTQNLRQSFLSPVLYKRIYERFKGKDLPVQMLDKLLVREFAVEADLGSRISGYFIDGVKFLNLLDGNKLVDIDIEKEPANSEKSEPENKESEVENSSSSNVTNSSVENVSHNTAYVIHIKGPGMDSKITINEEDDFLILEAMTRKIKKKLNEMGGE